MAYLCYWTGEIMTRSALIAKDSQKQLAVLWYPFDFLAFTITPLRKARQAGA